jgi:hypothetical protein
VLLHKKGSENQYLIQEENDGQLYSMDSRDSQEAKKGVEMDGEGRDKWKPQGDLRMRGVIRF